MGKKYATTVAWPKSLEFMDFKNLPVEIQGEIFKDAPPFPREIKFGI